MHGPGIVGPLSVTIRTLLRYLDPAYVGGHLADADSQVDREAPAAVTIRPFIGRSSSRSLKGGAKPTEWHMLWVPTGSPCARPALVELRLLGVAHLPDAPLSNGINIRAPFP
jgi:hypothetical protein